MKNKKYTIQQRLKIAERAILELNNRLKRAESVLKEMIDEEE